jgi:hypothetical protein
MTRILAVARAERKVRDAVDVSEAHEREARPVSPSLS